MSQKKVILISAITAMAVLWAVNHNDTLNSIVAA